jgi:hypothetical protein
MASAGRIRRGVMTVALAALAGTPARATNRATRRRECSLLSEARVIALGRKSGVVG